MCELSFFAQYINGYHGQVFQVLFATCNICILLFVLQMCQYLGFCFAKLTLRSRRQLMTESAQQSWILWRKKLSNGLEHSPADFLCAFSSPVTPEYVLRPTVSLYAITDKEAVFVETPEMINIYNLDVNPFFYVAQFIYAKKVIKMSIKDFVTLAENWGSIDTGYHDVNHGTVWRNNVVSGVRISTRDISDHRAIFTTKFV